MFSHSTFLVNRRKSNADLQTSFERGFKVSKFFVFTVNRSIEYLIISDTHN